MAGIRVNDGFCADCGEPAEQHAENYYRKHCRYCRHVREKYGISAAERTSMWETQGRSCKICKEPVLFHQKKGNTSRGVAVVDHCHQTKKVRGILCGACNTMLGKAGDRVDVLRAAADYLEE